MPKTWFRIHADGPASILRNRKLQTLPPPLFKWLINLWAFACRNNGCLPPLEDVAWELHLPLPTVSKIVSELTAQRFLEQVDGTWVVHDWSDHQFESDSSTERVRKFRKRKRNVSETPSRAGGRSVSVSESVSEWENDENYFPFVAAYHQAKPNVLPKELAEAYPAYLVLAFEDKLAAVQGIHRRIEFGIWNPGEPNFVTSPARYLQGEWERVITRPQKRPPVAAVLANPDEEARIEREIAEHAAKIARWKAEAAEADAEAG